MVNSHTPTPSLCDMRGFVRMREFMRLTSCLHSTPSHAMLWAGIPALQKCSSEIPFPMPGHRRIEGRERISAITFFRVRKQRQAPRRLWKARLHYICKEGSIPCLRAPAALSHVGCGATNSWQNCVSKSTTGCVTWSPVLCKYSILTGLSKWKSRAKWVLNEYLLFQSTLIKKKNTRP